MWWGRCSCSKLLLYGLQLFLLVAWAALTGIKIGHYLSEPTALRSRLDKEFRPPFVSIFPGDIIGFGRSPGTPLRDILIGFRSFWLEDIVNAANDRCLDLNQWLSRRAGKWTWWPILLHTHLFGVTTNSRRSRVRSLPASKHTI